MTGFLSKIFGKKAAGGNDPQSLIEATFTELLSVSAVNLEFELKDTRDDNYYYEIFGVDEDLLRDKEGQLLDAFQLFLTRVAQHRFPDLKIAVHVDNAGYREEANQELIDLAEKLKNIAMEKGKPVYFRALPPRDRKVIHQYLAEDGRVKSRSVGDGLFKKIKIFPIKGQDSAETTTEM